MSDPSASANLRCPICKAAKFIPFNGRDNARCSNCGAMERTRLLWLTLDHLGLFRPGLRVLHMAPEAPIAKRYSELCGDRYHACDIDPARYTSRYTTIRPLDLTCDLVKLPSRSFDLIIHSHVLEHLRCPIEPVLQELERLLAPGGHHLFAVPIRGDLTREDISEDLTAEQRLARFGQADHFRIFGAKSLTDMLSRVWQQTDGFVVEPLSFCTPEQLESAAIPKAAWSGISSHAIFHHQRPLYERVVFIAPDIGSAAGSAKESPRSAPSTGPHQQRRLLLHIGMPKTGTSSIQRWLFSCRIENRQHGADYWDIAENHSEALFRAFATADRMKRHKMWFQREHDEDSDGPAGDASAWRSSLAGFLSSLDTCCGLISAEALWTFNLSEITELAGFLSAMDIQVSVLCWVRKPADYLISAAQQRFRSSSYATEAHFNELVRDIRLNYARLDDWAGAFGRERLHVGPYGSDMLAEFTATLSSFGISLPPAPDQPALNKSMSMEASKALIALGKSRGQLRSKRLLQMLQTLDGQPFALPGYLLRRAQPIFAREAEYLESRFGMEARALLKPSAAVDDLALTQWSDEEVGRLLLALDRVMADLETRAKKPSAPAPKRQIPHPNAEARAANSDVSSLPRNRAQRRTP